MHKTDLKYIFPREYGSIIFFFSYKIWDLLQKQMGELYLFQIEILFKNAWRLFALK